MKYLYVTQLAIKGYHKFKIHPHEEIGMKVLKEPENSYDHSAMIVVMPELDDIPKFYHDSVTREAKQGEPQQRVKNNAGKTVGRVPANVCKIFNEALESGDVAKIVELVYYSRNSKLVLPHHLMESLETYSLTNSKTCANVFGGRTPGGSYSYLTSWLNQQGHDPVQFPDGIVKICIR